MWILNSLIPMRRLCWRERMEIDCTVTNSGPRSDSAGCQRQGGPIAFSYDESAPGSRRVSCLDPRGRGCAPQCARPVWTELARSCEAGLRKAGKDGRVLKKKLEPVDRLAEANEALEMATAAVAMPGRQGITILHHSMRHWGLFVARSFLWPESSCAGKTRRIQPTEWLTSLVAISRGPITMLKLQLALDPGRVQLACDDEQIEELRKIATQTCYGDLCTPTGSRSRPGRPAGECRRDRELAAGRRRCSGRMS